jgi:hypothetical protein
MSPDDIDKSVAIVDALLGDLAAIYPPASLALPFIKALVGLEAWKLKVGLNNGSLVSDGKGGIVPASNSKYDPKTGVFL